MSAASAVSAASAASGAGVLVIGYGNPLRADDGVGWRSAEAMAADPRLGGAAVRCVHQLLPELAPDVSEADLVILVDARVGVPAGSLAVESVAPDASGPSTWSHHVGPAELAGMARDLYGRVPPMFAVSVGAGSLEAGEGLSPEVERAIPGVLDAVAVLVGTHAPAGALAGVADA